MKRILNWFNLYDEDYSFFDSFFFLLLLYKCLNIFLNDVLLLKFMVLVGFVIVV